MLLLGRNLNLLFLLLVLLVSLISACANQIESPPNEDGKGKATQITAQVIAENNENPETTQPIEKPETKPSELVYIDQQELIDNIKDVMDADYYSFEHDQSNPEYIRSSKLKYYVIHTQANNKHIKNAKEFCDTYCAQNWDGWKYFQNMSNFRILHPILVKENFSSETEYRDYVTDAGYIRFKITEVPYNVANGKVLEYQLYTDYMDLFGNFRGVYDDSLIIYKIYCSPNMTVFLRPKREALSDIIFPAATLEDVDKSWDSHLIPIRKEFLEKANEILNKCPLAEDFFEDYEFQEYSKSEILTVHWRTYLKYYFNLTRLLSVGVEPSREEGKYVLKQINASFVNNAEYDLYDVGLEITVIADDKIETNYYDKEFYGTYRPGKPIINKSLSLKDIEFKDNITVDANLYSIYGKQEIRPQKYFFTKEDFVKK